VAWLNSPAQSIVFPNDIAENNANWPRLSPPPREIMLKLL